MNKIELERELDEMNNSDFINKLRPMLNIYTTSSQPDKGDNQNNNGRPKSDNSELTDSGAETRARGSNIEKGGEI